MPNFLPRLLALIALGSVGAAFPAWAQLSARMGSLSIEASQSSAWRPNTNYGVVKQTTASYRVLHQGQPVRFRDADGRTTELSFWDAWTLPDAQERQHLQPRKLSKPVHGLERIRDPHIGTGISRETTYLLMPMHPRMADALAALMPNARARPT